MKRRLVMLGALVALAFAPSLPARADSASAKPEAEAWYAQAPTCSTPLGCLPLPPLSNYPAGTMHIGVRAGFEESRTYMRLDLSGVPSDAALRGGTLTIPLAESDAGTLSPEAATVDACFAFAGFEPAEGSTQTVPAVDCFTSARATYNPGPPATLTVDLAPFAARWAAGEPNDGIALLPAPGAAPGTTWHVAFTSGSSAANLEYDPAPAGAPALEDTPPLEDTVFPALPVDAFTPPVASAAPIVAQAEQPQRVQPAFSITTGGFEYPMVFALPLLLLALGGYLGWALTRPVSVPGH